MVWFRCLLVAAVSISSIFVGVLPALADGAGCTPIQVLAGGCPAVHAEAGDGVVTLDGRVHFPGGNGTSPGASPGGGSGGSAAAPPDSSPPAVVRDGYTITMPVTLADLARFRPNAATDLMQPNGWMIVGLSTNFYAHASQHIKAGTLLGGPASVRFTPVRYAWTYGDGGTRTTSTPGATWSAQGINEFDATPTSHIYRAPGRYFIDLTVGYAPEYRLASSTAWNPVRGLVWGPANRLTAVASASAKTVLVEDECTINPAGPGC